MMNLSAPLEIFNPKEEEPEEKGGGQKKLRKSLIPFLEKGYGESHGQAAGDEEESIECSEGPIQLSSSQMKFRRILKPVDGVENEESPEEKDLRKEEEPHAYFGTGVVSLCFRHGFPKEIRSTKSETRNNSKIVISNVPNLF
jgi:hypothetical protein